MHKAYVIYTCQLYGDGALPAGEERTQLSENHSELIEKLIDERPYEVFSKYMKIKNN